MTRKLASALSSSMPAADARMSDDETSIQVLRAGSAIAIVFLVIYLAYDLWSGRGGASYGGIFHWVTVVGALGFLAASFTRGFRTHWKLWNLLFSILLISIFIMISAQTQEGDSRFIAILLFPVATAAFINWEWQWQALMGLACLVLYGVAQLLVPLPSDSVYRWFGLLAAIALARVHFIFHRRLSATPRRAG